MAILYLVSSIGCAFAWNWDVLMVARFIGGIGIGGSSVLGPVYIAELAPAKWRGRMVGTFQINIVIGILLAYLSNFIITTRHLGATEWRWEFGVAILPSVLFLVMLYGIPRSSRWLVTTNQTDEALDVLKLMGSPNSEAELQEIIASVHLEQGTKAEPVFQAKYAKPILLAISIGMFNQLSGINAILYYSNSIFAAAGFGGASASATDRRCGAGQPAGDVPGHELDRQAGAEDFAVDRGGGDGGCARWSGRHLRDSYAPGVAGLVPDALHRLLCAVAGCGHLGLHLRGLSLPRSVQGTEASARRRTGS